MHNPLKARVRGSGWIRYLVVGAVLGIALLHPAMIAVHRLGRTEPAAAPGGEGTEDNGLERSWFMPRSVAEWVTYALIGAGAGALAVYLRSAAWQARSARNPATMGRLVSTLIAAGEQEGVEFKASARWDHRECRLNRALEDAVGRTIAGFLNGRGGTLLLGLGDDRQAVGLEADYRTLRRPNADGYTQFLVGLIETRLGGDSCPMAHISFAEVNGREICRVDVEAADRPVYLREGNVARYFVRAGNTTRELDVAEALAHIERRQHGRTTVSVFGPRMSGTPRERSNREE